MVVRYTRTAFHSNKAADATTVVDRISHRLCQKPSSCAGHRLPMLVVVVMILFFLLVHLAGGESKTSCGWFESELNIVDFCEGDNCTVLTNYDLTSARSYCFDNELYPGTETQLVVVKCSNDCGTADSGFDLTEHFTFTWCFLLVQGNECDITVTIHFPVLVNETVQWAQDKTRSNSNLFGYETYIYNEGQARSCTLNKEGADLGTHITVEPGPICIRKMAHTTRDAALVTTVRSHPAMFSIVVMLAFGLTVMVTLWYYCSSKKKQQQLIHLQMGTSPLV